MKKLFAMALGTLMLVACGGKQGMSETELAALHEIDSLKAVNANQAKELEDFMEMAAQVEEGFRMIKEAEGRVDIKDANAEGVQKEQIAENMQFIQQTMQQNRELIDQLKRKLSKSSSNLSSLQKHIEMLEKEMQTQGARIQELQAQLAERDQLIAAQGEQIEQLNEDVTALTTENEQKTAEVAAQDKELNTAWFVFGTKNELKEQKILDSGDVLKNSNFNKGYFTQVDIRYDKDIRFYSKSAKLLTNHPSGSYQLVKDAKGEYELHITNPQQFWSVSKYLVVQVK